MPLRARRDGLGRHRRARPTKARPPAACRSRTAARRCASPAPRRAQILLELAAAKLGVAAANLYVSPTDTVTGWPGKVTYWELAREANLKREATGQGEAEAAGAAQDRRQQHPAPRHPGQGDGRRRLRAGPAAARHGARPRGAAAALWRAARQLRRGQGQGDAGRRRGGARRQLPRRRRRARGAGDQGAARADRASAKWTGGSELPDPAKLYEQLMSLRSAGHGDQREGRAAAGRRQGGRGDLPPALSGARLDRALLRGGASSRTASSRSGRTARASSRCARTLARALGHAAARRSAASTWKAPAATATTAPTTSRFDAALLARAVNGRPVRAAMDARRRVHVGALRPGHDHEGQGRRRRTAASSTGAYDVWSQSHNMRPGDPDGINLLGELVPRRCRSGPGRRAMPRSRTARATATRSRSTISRASASRTT